MSDQAFYHIMIERFEPAPDAKFMATTESYATRLPKEFSGVLESYFVNNASPDAGTWPYVRWMKFDSAESHYNFKYSDTHTSAVHDLVPRMIAAVGDLDMGVRKAVRSRQSGGQASRPTASSCCSSSNAICRPPC